MMNAQKPIRGRMENARQIAGVMGPALVAITLSETLNLRIWAGVGAPVVYLNGCLLFVAGVAVIRAHNRWTWRWPVLVTGTGWLLLLAGLYRMFAPGAPQGGENVVTYGVIAVLFAIGCVLSWKSFVPDKL